MRCQVYVVWSGDGRIIGKNTYFERDAFKLRPLNHKRVENGGAAICAKLLAPARSANTAHHILCVSLGDMDVEKRTERSCAYAPCS